MRTYAQARNSLTAQLRSAGWSVSREAMEPLREIDFTKLVAIHDHEEHFLEQTFIKTLLALRGTRTSTAVDRGTITSGDVETALRMLGVAAARQSPATLSDASKAKIKDACGFC